MNEEIQNIFNVLNSEKHYVPGTISILSEDKSSLKITAGQNANWTYANFFILPEQSSIREFNIHEGQFVVRCEEGQWSIYNYENRPVANGLEEIKDFVDAVTKAEQLRLNYLRGGTSFKKDKDSPLQIIYYGAPGTGKSYKIKEIVNECNHIRTTFHPDSDYASFVGAYKPTMSESSKHIYSKSELIAILKRLKDTGIQYPSQKFGADYWYQLQEMTATEIKGIINSGTFTESFYQEVNKGISMGKYFYDKGVTDRKIVYEFVAQAFLQAYTEAWKRSVGIMTDKEGKNVQMPEDMDDKYYLVIEEINRGNCAQIFGDLFQLLDRDDNGESSYAIRPDQDIKRYLAEQFVGLNALPDAIRRGDEMKLPSNLYIFATMNTSDQSLFPIDSAFKRRWDWEYVPIKDEQKGYYIKVDDAAYPWIDFLDKINETILRVTQSDDKQMGYWFVHLPEGQKEISTDKFVGKVLFYLWNDVFKDFGDGEDTIFIGEKEDGSTYELRFKDFFGNERDKHICDLMRYNGIEETTIESDSIREIANEEGLEKDIMLSSDGNPSSIGISHLNFWKKFKEKLHDRGIINDTQKAYTDNWHNITIGITGVYICLKHNMRDNMISTEIWFDKKYASSFFDFISNRKEQLDSSFNRTANWRSTSTVNMIGWENREFDLNNAAGETSAINWAAEKSEELWNAFKPLITQYKSNE